ARPDAGRTRHAQRVALVHDAVAVVVRAVADLAQRRAGDDLVDGRGDVGLVLGVVAVLLAAGAGDRVQRNPAAGRDRLDRRRRARAAEPDGVHVGAERALLARAGDHVEAIAVGVEVHVRLEFAPQRGVRVRRGDRVLDHAVAVQVDAQAADVARVERR